MCLALAHSVLIAASAGAQDIVRIGLDRATLAWTPPASGSVTTYGVLVSTNGGSWRLASYVSTPRITLSSQIGSSIQVRVFAIGMAAPGEPLTTSPVSSPSERILFLPSLVFGEPRLAVLRCAECATLEMRSLDQSAGTQVIPSLPASWQLLAVDNLNAVGDAALWHHPPTGTLSLLPIGIDTEQPTVLASRVAPGYRPLGVAELDGDAAREIVVATPDGRAVEFWEVRGSAIARAGGVSVRSDWRFAKAADLDGDGLSELWWQTHVPGFLEVWKVSMTSRLDVLARVATGAEGNLVEVADFDGDGVLDALWRDDVWGVLAVAHFTPGGGGDLGALEELVWVPWVQGDADLLVRDALDLDGEPGAEILLQDRSTYRVHAIFSSGSSAPGRAVLFDVGQKSELVLVR